MTDQTCFIGWVDELRKTHLGDHPFLKETGQLPVDLGRVRVILRNAHAFSARTAPYFAAVAAAVRDQRARFSSGKLLMGELGSDSFEDNHLDLYEAFTNALEPCSDSVDSLEPGRRLVKAANACFLSGDGARGLGAILAGEFRAMQFNEWLSKAISAENRLGLSTMEWFTEHRELEPHHIEEVLGVLDTLIDDRDRNAARDGAFALDRALLLFEY